VRNAPAVLRERTRDDAAQGGVKLVISTDAHSTSGLDVMRCGILQARRAGLEAKDVVNTRTLAQLKKLLRK
jgi:DNA polymerase (family 10)